MVCFPDLDNETERLFFLPMREICLKLMAGLDFVALLAEAADREQILPIEDIISKKNADNCLELQMTRRVNTERPMQLLN
mmetsp:Transcript_13460/g.17730  ORF Transcript_13460/g.17730 Transcript_13460/m.17730 type:complete len:80 (+) Transcript_13460:579-818(+)|eukprot:CAMPEP_0117758040 /NCGR_PEP_ID=MMETSP0947-20121206/15130_1 /TAXON_ID=44440 /ORGANISM="Chattonella subsalsa, Strain CCMP2191" /LENGTH=79 /DNA_ID=CAMNT_0005578129 /DNA_START=525 /DNA_END=761 /DNA_ORIENTATION=+